MYHIFTNTKGQSKIIHDAHVVSILKCFLADDFLRGSCVVIDSNGERWVFETQTGQWTLQDALAEIKGDDAQ